MENKKKILMIDEDRFLRKVYREKFSKEGFEFLEATNGIEGLNKILFEKPDVVILDLILPGKTGFDVLIEAKMKRETKNIPFIILSNLSQESDVKKGLELGAIDYLIKSEVSLSDVVKKVKEIILKMSK
jgi:DNA-binding response OmpR family regulator